MTPIYAFPSSSNLVEDRLASPPPRSSRSCVLMAKRCQWFWFKGLRWKGRVRRRIGSAPLGLVSRTLHSAGDRFLWHPGHIITLRLPLLRQQKHMASPSSRQSRNHPRRKALRNGCPEEDHRTHETLEEVYHPNHWVRFKMIKQSFVNYFYLYQCLKVVKTVIIIM